MASTTWKNFEFFKVTTPEDRAGHDVEDGLGSLRAQAIEISAVAASRGHLLFGDNSGSIHVYSINLDPITIINSVAGPIHHLYLLKMSNLVVSIEGGIDGRPEKDRTQSITAAEDARAQLERQTGDSVAASAPTSSAPDCHIRVWQLDEETTDMTVQPQAVRAIKVFSGEEEVVTAACIMESPPALALGTARGRVLLFNNPFVRERRKRAPRELRAADGQAITNLHFGQVEAMYAGAGREPVLYGTTTAAVFSVRFHGLTTPDMHVFDEGAGAGRGCAVLSNDDQYVVTHPAGVYFFYGDVSRGVRAVSGDKASTIWYRNYLMYAGFDAFKRPTVFAYDIANRFNACRWQVPAGKRGGTGTGSGGRSAQQLVRSIVCDGSTVIVLTVSHEVFLLTEISNSEKFRLLNQTRNFKIAIDLAKRAHFDTANLMDIYREYGDSLYSENAFGQAMQQYISTIGHVEPSYVIQRFLEPQHTSFLMKYLEELHALRQATGDHTQLLLNCYTKLKATSKLQNFIRGRNPNEPFVPDSAHDFDMNAPEDEREPIANVTFDVETAISVLRTSGEEFVPAALYLARKHRKHEWYLSILLEDSNDFDKALEYVSRLPFLQAEMAMKKHGRALLGKRPAETTSLLKRLCTDFKPKGQAKGTDAQPASSAATPAGGGSSSAADGSGQDRRGSTIRTRSEPEDFIPIFVDHALFLKEFLQHIVDTRAQASKAVWNTWLELWLRDDAWDGSHKDRSDHENQVLEEVLKHPKANYDPDHALVLVRMHDLKRCQRYLFEKREMYDMVIRQLMEIAEEAREKQRPAELTSARQAILQKARANFTNAKLWHEVLEFFVTNYTGSPEEDADIEDMLQQIQKHRLLQPLVVLSTLSKRADFPFRMVRNYAQYYMMKDAKQARKYRKAVRDASESTQELKRQIVQLREEPKEFAAKRCSMNDTELTLPAVHFMCGHSFKVDALEGHDTCLHRSCATRFESIRKKVEAHRIRDSLHEDFNQELNLRNRDQSRFDIVAKYFGKGLFADIDAAAGDPPAGRP